jgi:hypothetical protein
MKKPLDVAAFTRKDCGFHRFPGELRLTEQVYCSISWFLAF